jgi:hypothetical protein
MKRILMILFAMVVVVGMLAPVTVSANNIPEGFIQICVGNIPAGGVTGGTEHGFCEEGSENEWHIVLIGLDPAGNYPDPIIATFQNAGAVEIPWEKHTGNADHYRLTDEYLTDTLLSVCAIVPEGTTYTNFNLSHAPCPTDGNGGPYGDEVGGDVYPIDKAVILAPVIALAVVVLSGTGILVWRRQTHK